MTIKLPLQRYNTGAHTLSQHSACCLATDVAQLEAAYAELERNLRELQERYSDLAVAHLKCTRRNDALEAERDGLHDRLKTQGDEIMRQLYALCEETEDLSLHPKLASDAHATSYLQGRIFEAKGIRRVMGEWFRCYCENEE